MSSSRIPLGAKASPAFRPWTKACHEPWTKARHAPSSSESFPCSLAPPCTLRLRKWREQRQLQLQCRARPAHLEPARPYIFLSSSVPPHPANPGRQPHGRCTDASRSYPPPPPQPRREASPESARERGGPCWQTKAWRRGQVSCLSACAELRHGHKRAAVTST